MLACGPGTIGEVGLGEGKIALFGLERAEGVGSGRFDGSGGDPTAKLLVV